MKTLNLALAAFTSLFLAAALLAVAPAEAQKQPAPQKKVYKWVDENGEVHFSESLPPDFEDRKHDIIDSRGMTRAKDQTLVPPPPKPRPVSPKGELPRDSSGAQRPEPRYSAQELKVQQDQLLLLRYDSDKEILDAMEVEIKQLDYDRRLITASIASLQGAYDGNIREAAERQRAGQVVEPKLIQNIGGLKSRMAREESSLASLRQREEEIRTNFKRDLDRYRTLVAEQARQQG
ncbi:MAG TPA: DUF4124 domain-containing protein [Xanthomonadales bacterium]|nr:DUF4124 domain-containing protein [Xanthomonadales bacterium]